MTSDVRWLKASKLGNGVGVAFVRSDGPLLILNVLPKIASWRDSEHAGPCYIDITAPLLLPQRQKASRVEVTIHEGDVLKVPADYAVTFRSAAAESPQSEDTGVGEETETCEADTPGSTTDYGAMDRLFDEVAEPRMKPHADCMEQALRPGRDKVQHLWNLVSANDSGLLDRLPIQNQELLGTIAPHFPPLKPLIMHAFVVELANAVRHRRHAFQPQTEDLLAIRGRIDTYSLADREARGTLPVTCHFDDLSHDSPAWRVLRAANRLIVNDEDAEVDDRTLAAQLDNRLSDVEVIPTPRAVQSLVSIRGSLEERSLRGLLRLARCVLTMRYPVGVLSDDATDFATEIKVPTSGLWETLLATALNRFTRYRAHTQGAGSQIHLFEHGRRKKPDIILTDPDHRTKRTKVKDVNFVIDAKYKELRPPKNLRKKSGPSMSWLSMSDQYQCFAYSTLLDAPTLFITVGSDDGCVTRTSPIPGQTEDGHAVGIAPVPFPVPGEITLSKVDIAKVVDWLEDNDDALSQPT
ncbi:MAG TPA: McrC family protein [Candidatus Corynebacterium avicola]|uniref:McrC family protein n=1 Tax=Candidatus Corynebacterium avicola TaxID=2838527 RepID=A0A9D1RNW7_9CORY|nr:McrC family protein [Candidatus Corynebacterium avicola]